MSYNKGTFKKGRKPWNKGKKGVQVAWNKSKSIKKSHPQMGFQNGNELADNSKSKTTRFKKGERPSIETEFKKGCKPWNWMEDRSQLKKSEDRREDSAHIDWSRRVKNRDSWKCKISNEDCNGRLESHHILNWKDYPELRYEINNGITLCSRHHPRGRRNEKKMIPMFQELLLGN